MSQSRKHFIAIIGGSIAGSEAAYILAEKGFHVVVFDQKNLPYGKIEDGLPMWHIGLRDKEEQKIDQRLSHQNIQFVPGVRLGQDITLDALNDWGFSAVIIAIGAWLDRKLPIKGIDAFRGSGLIYQNDLLYWYNHRHEPTYNGPLYTLPDRTAVIGGGLASIDVVKMIMIETTQKALKKQKNIHIDLFAIEKKGVAKILEENNTSLDDLGLSGCTLFYRKRIEDMPLYPRKGEAPEDIEKAKRVTKKLLANYKSKYLFNFEPLSTLNTFNSNEGKLTGVSFQKEESESPKEEIYKYQTTLVISSIGSLPEVLPSIPYNGSYLKTYGEFGHRIKGFKNVFAIGNVVTGKGNILDSKKHGREITGKIIDGHFSNVTLQSPMEENYYNYFRQVESKVDLSLGEIVTELNKSQSPTEAISQQIINSIKDLQLKVGYTGIYQEWVDSHRPVRLEDLK